MKYYFLYIDILGFESFVNDKAKRSRLEPEEVREIFQKRVLSKLKIIQQKGYILNSQQITLDSWLLISNHLWNCFKGIKEILKSKLLFEIVIETKEIPNLISAENSIFLHNQVISFLKNDINNLFKLNKKLHNDLTFKTFILISEEVYTELDSKNICQKDQIISRTGIPFYSVEVKEFLKTSLILEFLEKIGIQNKDYRLIEHLFQKPRHYGEIKSILDKYNIVILFGDPEMGKTYTAVYLLFEYFKKNYKPNFCSIERNDNLWMIIRNSLSTPTENMVFYFEDPWGRVEFQGERENDKIVEIIKFIEGKNIKLIITTRGNIFKTIKEKNESFQSYPSIEFDIKSTYKLEDLIKILENYCSVFNPTWNTIPNLKNIAISAINNELRTPMSIKRLVEYTINTIEEDKLKEGIKRAAGETNQEFVNEIFEMFERKEYEKIVFLSLTAISIPLRIANICFEDILEYLNKQYTFDILKSKRFSDLLEFFGNQIKLQKKPVWAHYETIEHLGFSHPSYFDAFYKILETKGKPSIISDRIFSLVLIKVSNYVVHEYPLSAYQVWNLSCQYYWDNRISERFMGEIEHNFAWIAESDYLI